MRLQWLCVLASIWSGWMAASAYGAAYPDAVMAIPGLQVYYRMNENGDIGDALINAKSPGSLDGFWGYNNTEGFNADTAPTAQQPGPGPSTGFRGLEDDNFAAGFEPRQSGESPADQFDLGSPAELDAENATIAVFFKTPGDGNDSRIYSSDENAKHQFRIVYGSASGGYGNMYVLIDGWDQGKVTTQGGFGDDKWHQLVAIREGDTRDGVQIYLDGNEITQLNNVADGFSFAGSARIGARHGTDNQGWGGFKGNLDEFAFWNRALTDTEVKSLYRAAVGGSPCDLNQDGAVDAADAGIMFGDWGGPGSTSAADKNADGFVDAADAGIMFADWTGDPATPGPNAATAEYNAATGELKISSAGAVNVFVQSAGSHITPLNPAPSVPVGLLTNNASRVGITNLGPINVTGFSFGNIGVGLAESDLKLVYTPALGQKGIEIAAGAAGFKYIPEPASIGLGLMGFVAWLGLRRR